MKEIAIANEKKKPVKIQTGVSFEESNLEYIDDLAVSTSSNRSFVLNQIIRQHARMNNYGKQKELFGLLAGKVTAIT